MKRDYPCIEINLGKIKHNTEEIVKLCKEKGIHVVGVSKVFCAKKPIVRFMLEGGVAMIGDSRLENLKRLEEINCRKMLLRIPMGSHAKDVVKYSDISLNSEIETIKRLSLAARRLRKVHSVILMVDVGDLREGVLEKDVIDTVKEIIKLNNIRLEGLGTNLTCYGGVIPDENNLGKLIILRDTIKELMGLELPIISGGNSSSIHLILDHTIPKGINELRIGEAIVLGRETAYGKSIPNCHKDCFILKGEIIEIKSKPSIPTGNIGMDAFGQKPTFQDRGIIKRAIVAMGKQDVSISGLQPVDNCISILGGSSDHLILDITQCKNKYEVGDIIDFNMDYGCLLMSMTSPYVKKYYVD